MGGVCLTRQILQDSHKVLHSRLLLRGSCESQGLLGCWLGLLGGWLVRAAGPLAVGLLDFVSLVLLF